MSNDYQVREAKTPLEMRAELFRLSYYDTLIRAVFDAANASGMSSEDRYTILAYHALKQRNTLMEASLDRISLEPTQHVILDRKRWHDL